MTLRPLPRPAAFAAASAALISVFLASGTPIPLFNLYRVEDHIANSGIAFASVLYLSVTAASLLLLGRLSDHIGRKPVLIGALLSAITGCLILAHVHTLPVLLIGRALQGIACGLASSAAGAMVIDLAPRTRVPWLPAVITSTAPPFAIPLGAILAGALVEHAPAPRTTAFCLMVIVLVAVLVSVILAPLGGTITSGLRTTTALRTGLAIFVIAITMVVLALYNGAIAPFLLASAIAGIAQGAANGAGMRGVLGGTSPTERAGTLATLYLISYTGGAAPGLISGRLADTLPLTAIITGYAALSLLAVAVAVRLTSRHRARP
ncbi:MAG: MFS transporter [Brachybacterium faecium]|nr:MAG: MFS transporter [Brachybacterium faecium]